MLGLIVLVFAALGVVAYLESPARDHERSMNACVKACVRQPHHNATRPTYRWYY